MRGKGNLFTGNGLPPGITPAYAGKSLGQLRKFLLLRDHPRVCGEKKLAEFEDESGEGSPPRMRGKGILRVVLFATRRITPAYAGKSGIASHQAGYAMDHPRVCGEKLNVNCFCFLQVGSPPRMRGKD